MADSSKSSNADEVARLAESYLGDQQAIGGAETWEQYSQGVSIYNSLTSIQEFLLILDIPPLPEVGDSKFAASLATDLYSSLLAAIEQAEFFHEDEISLGATPGQASLTYGDDRYDFTLAVSTGTIRISRSGSKLKDFHDWYAALAPRLPTLVAGVLDVLRSKTEREYRVFRGAYIFNFLLHDLRHRRTSRQARNSDIMRTIVNGVPDDAGSLSVADQSFDQASRIDVNMTRWAKLEHGRRIERYKIEAPANKEGAGLWLQFAYGGETYTAPDTGKREQFDHRSFVAEYDWAYRDFLRDKAVKAFLASLMQDFSFNASAGNLP